MIGDDMMMLGVLAIGGFLIWQMTRSKPAQAAPRPTTPSGATKTATTEGASVPLSVWQGLTGEQLATLPVTMQIGTVGAETYYKTSQPVAIGDTGFKIWGMTENGAVVISQKDPATYPDWEWY
jgi:hypothetical protein